MLFFMLPANTPCVHFLLLDEAHQINYSRHFKVQSQKTPESTGKCIYLRTQNTGGQENEKVFGVADHTLLFRKKVGKSLKIGSVQCSSGKAGRQKGPTDLRGTKSRCPSLLRSHIYFNLNFTADFRKAEGRRRR